MRLNIGCGKQYIPGYINIDLFEQEIADVSVPADSLDFVSDNSVEEIISNHLIEHLGLINSYQTLAHWAIKLKPGGKIAIETPNLENSLKSLITTKSKKDIDWLFGVCDPGQIHQRPFFSEELVKILKLLGFDKIQIKEPLGYWKNNTIRIEGIMGKSDFKARVIEKWCDLKPTQGTFYELPFDRINPPISEKNLAEMAIISPILSIKTLEVLKTQDQKLRLWKQVLNELNQKKLTQFLYTSLINYDRKPQEQNLAVKNITNKAKKIIVKSLKNGQLFWDDLEQINNSNKLTELFEKYSYLTKFFSSHNINEFSLSEYANGIKAFSNKKYKLASKHFKLSIKLNSQNSISWWNLARIEWINGNRENADNAYDCAYELSLDRTIFTEKARSIPIKRPLEISYAVEI